VERRDNGLFRFHGLILQEIVTPLSTFYIWGYDKWYIYSQQKKLPEGSFEFI